MEEKDYYSCDELIALYRQVGADQAALNAAAKVQYPERVKAPEIRVETGLHGRWFPLDEEREEFAAPVYTIKGGKCSWVGIMEDGTAHEY